MMVNFKFKKLKFNVISKTLLQPLKGPLFKKTSKVDIENPNQIKSSNTGKPNGNDVKQVREEKKTIKNSPRTFTNLSITQTINRTK
jgi:hypothetical protein